MDASKWERVKQLFGSAVERQPAQRGAFLAEACRGDPSLLQEVESLLAAHQDAATTLGGTGLGESAAGKPASEGLISGRRIGPYEVVRRIGQGGMAAVYLAVRADDQYKKRVAIKLIPPGLDSEDLLRRLRNERQTLAALDHPDIVKLLDGGTTEDGLPYLVMDYIEGTPIDDYCDHHKLSTDERLRLFLTVCAAVSYAHQRLVIHRDLKPDNILVTADGTPKLLDFGIAKLLNPEALATLVVTGTGQRAMTPEYASPEQVRGEPLTNATDVYSLGVVLYELLTGHRLYRLKTHAMAEMERAICEEEPLKPSTVVTRAEEESLPDGTTKATTPEEISRVRVADPKKLRSRLHGDLDAIVMTALRKEPQRRYSSIYDFSEDIRRHLDGRPIKARPSTLAYRMSKFLRRHREAVAASLVFAGVIAALGIAGTFYYRSYDAKPLTDKDAVVLADFDNKTGDGVFDGALKQAMAVELEQSPFLNILSERRVSATLRSMGRSPSERITTDVGREICQRTGSKAVLGGSVSSMGSHYWIGFNAAACYTGDILAEEEVEASRKEDVLKALSQACSRLRTKLGESLPSVQKFDVPIEATTSSLEALKNYSMGEGIFTKGGGEVTVIPFFKRAIELDPHFASAYGELASVYYDLNKRSLALEFAAKAYQLLDHASEREKLHISAIYFRTKGEVQKENEIYELFIAEYPRFAGPHEDLGVNYTRMGQYDQALGEFQEAVRLRPDNVGNRMNLGNVYYTLNRFDEAKATFDDAIAHKLDSGDLREQVYLLAFLRRDRTGMAQQVEWAMGKRGYEDQLFSEQSDTEAYYGRIGRARDFSRRAVESAVRTESKEAAALWRVNAALREAELGNAVLARQGVAAALALSQEREVMEAAAMVSARVGDVRRVKSLLKELGQRYPADAWAKGYWLPTLNAAVRINQHDPSRALSDLEAAAPFELGQPTFINYLYPAYVRGQAYLLAHNGTAAAAEFQKLLDHPGIVVNFVTGALAHLQIGRAYAMAGDTAKAKAAYLDFFSLWEDADSDIPILKQAKAEYAKLQ